MRTAGAIIVWAAIGLATTATCQTMPAGSLEPPTAGPPAPTAPAEASPEVRAVLKMLHDRKDTLKEFTGKIDYSVFHPQTLETDGKRGTVDYLVDPTIGPEFSVDFTQDTEAGKAVRMHHQQVIFDGRDVTTKDFRSKEIMRENVLPAGAKPGDAVSLNGPMPLPIGVEVDDVVRTFEVTMGESKDPDQVALKFVPRAPGKFDFKQLEILVDRKLELPVKVVQTARNRDVTTIQLQELQINKGQARMQDPNPPAREGWTERKPSQQ